MNANSKCALFLMCAGVCCTGVVAKEAEDNVKNDNPAAVVAEEAELDSLFEFDVGWSFDSKFMSYGLVDNNDPIVTPHASVTMFDWLAFEASAIFDVTKYGRKAGYHNRASRYTELDPAVSLTHSFSPDDYEFLPTTIEFALGYSYEYHPRSMGGATGEPGDDTQFVTFEFALPDLWLEPTFMFERDIDRDNGTYLNLEIGHTFALIDGNEDDDPVLAFRPSVAQGLGTTQRTRGYGLAEHHGGLMDLCVKGELEWIIAENITIAGYLAYIDYVFDSTLREAAREYEATGRNRNSYNFVTGISVCVTF